MAYDGVFQWVVELVLAIKGVPVEYIAYLAELMERTETAVITPFGLTEWFKRVCGLPQGGTHRVSEVLTLRGDGCTAI